MSLPTTLTLGQVHLTVANLDRSLAFYQNGLGFRLHRREGATAYLGAGEHDLLALTENTDAKPYARRTGLYHFAVLVPSRFELARSLQRLSLSQTPVQGFSDHLVSEAIYLADPDLNGIEIYRDRPRDQWQDEQGRFRMGSEPLDLDGILAELHGREAEPWHGLAAGTTLGHMHLKVADIAATRAFYCDLLRFDLMASWHNALFVSAGGYHHHLGLNTWESAGAPPPPPEATGLNYFTIQIPNRAERESVLDRVRAGGGIIEEHPLGLLTRDPAQNALVFANQMSVNSAQATITATLLSWSNVSAHPHRFGGTEYRYGAKRELGHIHGDELVDIPFPTPLRAQLVAEGRAQPHHILPESGWISFYIRTPADVERAVALLKLSYDLAVRQKGSNT